MRALPIALLAVLSSALLPAEARAHYVWAEMKTDGGRKVSLALAEGPNRNVLPAVGRLAPKIRLIGAEAAKGTPAGDAVVWPLLRPASAVLAYVPYGATERDGKTMGLEYYAKAVENPTDAARPIGKGFEIVAEPLANGWRVTALLDGKPAPDAQIVSGEAEAETKSALGAAVEIPINAAPVAIRAVREFDRSGSADGKSFTRARQWTSLILPPLPPVTPGSDADAFRALQAATEARETLREGLAPWAAPFRATNGTEKLAGEAKWLGKGAPAITFTSEENGYTKHVRSQLGSLFMHRMGGDFAQGDGKSVVTWTNDTNELGRRMLVKDRFDSSYRLKDGRIRQVVRTIGESVLTLDILDIQETGGGRYLSKRYRAVTRDVKTGGVRNDLIYTDDLRLVNGEWLPMRRRVEGTADGDKIFMQVEFDAYRPLDAASAKAGS